MNKKNKGYLKLVKGFRVNRDSAIFDGSGLPQSAKLSLKIDMSQFTSGVAGATMLGACLNVVCRRFTHTSTKLSDLPGLL